MKTLRIYNYEILNFEDEPIIFSASGFTKITEPKLTRALKRIEKTRSKYITHDALDTILTEENLQPERSIEFLQALSIIGEEAAPPYLEHTIIYHDFDISKELEKYINAKTNGSIELQKITAYVAQQAITPTLFILAFTKLRPAALRSMYFDLANVNPEGAISIGHVSNNYFHLTEAYLPSIGNPCAFCTLDRIAHYETLRTSQHHWSKIWTFCRKNHLDLPCAQIDELQKSLILGLIISFSKKLTQAPTRKLTQDQVLLSKTINLDTGYISEDISVHWPLCQCRGPKP
ncbi:McbB family protein [Pseudomonas sp. NPDC090233]|uniref:McbB family protein n=1 Tax=Pseudomonas sp. NPDC090233 TaxID=3364479 RepID=UPI00383BB8F0